jgi:glycosyltransferase 2 family protein
MSAPATRSRLGLLLKTAFVAGLLYFLSRKGFLSLEATRRALTQWEYVVPAFTGLAVTTFLGVVRWKWLLGAQGVHLSWRRVLQIAFVGNFFNIALPGAVSGDLVKAIYVGHEAPDKRGRAFGSILFDRVAGLSALCLVSAGALAYSRVFGLGHEVSDGVANTLRSEIQLFVVAAAAVTVAGYAYLFGVREHHDPVLRLFKRLEGRFPRAGSLTRIYEGLREYHAHPLIVLRVLLLSILIHLAVGWSCLQFAHALGDTGLVLLEAYILVPLGLLVTAIPILPAGVGTGNAAFGALFSLVGAQRGADAYSLVALSQIFWGAVGGIVYLRFRRHEGAALPAATLPEQAS